MPKMKTNKSLAKRVKKTKKGKLLIKRPNKTHFRSVKNGRAIQSFRRKNRLAKSEARKVEKAIN